MLFIGGKVGRWLLRYHCLRRMSSIKQVVEDSPQRICVLHGSHSGNTHRYAKYLHAELKWRLNIDAGLKSISSLDFSDLDQLGPKDTLLLLVSTYGVGEPNEATLPLWDELIASKKLQLSYSVMARGSSLYETTFAHAGISIDEQLESLGAHRLAPLGIQDKISLDGEDQYFLWKEGVVAALKDRDNLKESPFIYVPSSRPASETDLKSAASEEPPVVPEPLLPRLAKDAEPTPVKITTLQSTDRQYLHAEFALDSLDKYEPGDYIVVWPTNSESVVETFLTAVFGDSDRRRNLVHYRGHTTTYEMLARYYLDIHGQPERELLLKLAFMAPSTEIGDRIRQFTQSHEPVPSLANLLATAGNGVPWMESLPLPSTFFDLLPHLEPRRYSISSSPVRAPSVAGISFVVEHDEKTGFWGTATGEMKRIGESQKSEGSTNPISKMMVSHERLPRFNPPSLDTPMLLFGVGTGVAPFRGFVRERSELVQELKQQQGSNVKAGPTVLFTGTRTPQDLLYRSEFENLSKSTDFSFMHIPAYSRSLDTPNPKYITETIAQNHDLIYDMMQKGAHIYVCGDIRKVRRSVLNGVGQILMKKEGLSPPEAKAKWKSMNREGRIHLELW